MAQLGGFGSGFLMSLPSGRWGVCSFAWLLAGGFSALHADPSAELRNCPDDMAARVPPPELWERGTERRREKPQWLL